MYWSIVSVQSLSHVPFFAIPWIAACQASLSITNSRSSLKPMCIESMMPSSHLILCHPLLLLQASLSITNSQSSLKPMCIESMMPSSHLILCHPLLLRPSIPPSIRVFTNESTPCMRWPKYWSFSFSISPSNDLHDINWKTSYRSHKAPPSPYLEVCNCPDY